MGMYMFWNGHLAMKGSGEEVDSETEGFTDRGGDVAFKNRTEDATKRGSIRTHAAELYSCVSHISEL
ncbi:hypothetical protein V6N12_066599 [Hibiscus sabdariffa]